ncbi:MAG: sigma 54-interacting transcriptional regulator [Clostridia bacterium]|nr:sigma 54-interacting transcriptional regulator [Clostridia bacterium]
MDNFKTVLDSVEQGILVCDENGRIEFFNDSYGEFVGKRLEDVKGIHLTELRPGAVAPTVLKTGEPIHALRRKESGQDYFADIYPVKKDGRTVGTVSIVTNVDHANYLSDQLNELRKEEARLKVRMSLTNGTHYTFDSIIGESIVIRNTIELARRIAGFDSNVLLQGESGTGKELFSQAIHNASSRRSAPFVAINCAAISKTLLESELFGYEEGAFTGARKGGKAGLFEAAEGGTIFLDEVSEMDFDLQAKLLRVLQEKKFRRIGGIKEINTNVRVICACNVDIKQYIADKKFRSDLYYRISVAPINVPPLRERRIDIPLLARRFLDSAEIQNKRTYKMTEDAKKLMMSYTWPGNIRELKNAVEYSAMMAKDGIIDTRCLPHSITLRNAAMEDYYEDALLMGDTGDDDLVSKEPTNQTGNAEVLSSETLAELVSSFEKRQIKRAIKLYGNTTEGKRKAAEALGISLSSLYAKLGKK